MTLSEDPASMRWHVDKRFPVVLLFGILCQTGAGVWWAAQLSENVQNNAAHIADIRLQINDLQREVIAQGREDTSIARQLEATNASLSLLRQDVRETNALLRNLFASFRPSMGAEQ